MTTPRDLDTAAEVSLKICEKCGWYDGFTHERECSSARGRLANRLIEAIPDVRSGKLGYGVNRVVFDLSDDFSLAFGVDQSTFSLDHTHLIGDLSLDETVALVRALKGWQDEIAAKRSKR